MGSLAQLRNHQPVRPRAVPRAVLAGQRLRDGSPVAVNAAQISFISYSEEGTRIRFGEGRSVTVVEPPDEIMDRLNKTQALPEG